MKQNKHHHVSWQKTATACATVVLLGSAGYLAIQGGGGSPATVKVVTSAGVSGSLSGSPALSTVGAPSSLGSGSISLPASGAVGALDAMPQLFTIQGAPIGAPLLAKAGVNSDTEKGRVLVMESAKTRNWSVLKAGSTLALPTASGDLVEGFVNLSIVDNGWVRIGGELADGTGTFTLSASEDEVAGAILRPSLGVGYQIVQDGNDVLLVERRLTSLLCAGSEIAGGTVTTTGTVSTTTTRKDVPLLNTRPGAKGVIFTDFAGASVTDPSWNGGKTIVAAPSSATPATITSIVKAVAEDFAPFDLTVTTDPDLYAATPAGLRMRAVVTPTNTAAPGSGGVAYIGAWASAGKGFKSDTVCWVFNGGGKVCADTISHEVGHTLGLYHDGRLSSGSLSSETYYAGHGGGTNIPTSWGPIMGAPFSVNLSQWSKGEYARANNTQDDVAVIASATNKFGYLSNFSSSVVLPASLVSGSFMSGGLLQRASSADTFVFRTKGGQFTASARPMNVSTNADVQLALSNGSGASVAVSSLPDALSAAINTTLPAGEYTLSVRPAGTGPKPSTGYVTGYSEYGSLGGYVLSGVAEGVTKEPIFGNARDFVGIAGKPVAFPIAASDATTVTIKSGSLPDGLTLDSQKKLITGVCAEDTDGAVALELTATNQYGSVDADFSIKINEASASISTALGSTAYNIINSTNYPWTGVMKTDANGVVRAVAESGRLVNGGSSSLRFASFYNGDPKRASAYYLFSFWWKASTEADHDIVSLRVAGAAVKDFVTGLPVRLSGETDWVQQTVRVPVGTYPAFEFVYSKDATLSAGRDRVYMYVDSFGLPPIVVNQPPAVITNNTATWNSTSTISLSSKVDGAESVVWMKDGVTLKDGTSSSGSIVSGANSGNLLVTKASGADSGSYWLEARNSYGTITSSKSLVTIGSVPVITQQLVAPVGLKVGDTLVLSVSAVGTNPLTYQWWKDGTIRTVSSSATYQKAKITTLDAGSYSVRVSNGFGTAVSTGVMVSVGSATTVTTGTLNLTNTTATTTK